MADNMQFVIVTATVAAAAGYLARRAWRLLSGTPGGCPGCGTCHAHAAGAKVEDSLKEDSRSVRPLPLVTLDPVDRHVMANATRDIDRCE